MKKIWNFGKRAICIPALLLALLLSACGSANAAPLKEDGKKLSIVTTIFPEYDWTKNILGDNAGNAELKLLMDNGTDLHSYQPTAADILTIGSADLFIYVGGESDAWVTDALSQAINKDMIVINLMDVLGDRAKEEELVEGTQGEEEEEDGEEEEGPEYDEHVWLSLNNAALFTDAIADALGRLDPGQAAAYSANAAAYKEKLSALDQEYQAAVQAGARDTLLFGDRFPFRYLTEDYRLNYYAAFIGCSAESEASFETVIFLAGKVDSLSLPVILTIDNSDQRIAETIRDNTAAKDQQILTLDSMQSVTAAQITEGTDYLKIMESNLDVLKNALK